MQSFLAALQIRQGLMSVIFPPAFLGPEIAAPISWAPGLFHSFCWKTPMPIKIPRFSGERKNANKKKHISIFLTALPGQSSQGRTSTHPRDKRDKLAILLWNSTENGRFVPRAKDGSWFVPGVPRLSQRRFLFVPNSVPPTMLRFRARKKGSLLKGSFHWRNL